MGKQFLEIGKITGTHGIKGELRIEPWCDTPEFFCRFKVFYYADGAKLTVVSARPHKNIVILKAKGIDKIEKADLLLGRILHIDRNDAKLPTDTYFIQDIIGLKAKDVKSGCVYGKVTDVFKTGANDVYEIADKEGKKYYIPVIPDVVIKTDIASGELLICPIKGIFDDAD